MGVWNKILAALRLGAVIAGAQGVTVKGVPIGKIAEEAEKDGAAIKSSVDRIKAARDKKAAGPRPVK